MPAVYVRETNGRPAEITFDRRVYHRSFLVKMDRDHAGQIEVTEAQDPDTNLTIPTIGDVYDNGAGDRDPFAWASRIAPRPVVEQDNHVLWTVDVEYSSDLRGVGWYEWEWTTNKEKVPFRKSVSPGLVEKNVLTTAGEPFDPAPQKDEYYPVLRHVRVEAEDPIVTMHAYLGKVNDREFPGPMAARPAGFGAGWGAWRALLNVFTGKPRKIGGGVTVFDVRREFIFTPAKDSGDQFIPRYFLNAGFRAYNVAATPPAKEIRDATGSKPSRPKLIQLLGTYSADLQKPEDAVYLEFYDKFQANFDDFNLKIS
jgi:hypothetical protein